MLDAHIAEFLVAGSALLALTVLPRVFPDRPLSLPIVYVAAGAGLFWASEQLAGPMPLTSARHSRMIEVVTELVVIVSLAGVGLKLERRPGLASWSSVWRLGDRDAVHVAPRPARHSPPQQRQQRYVRSGAIHAENRRHRSGGDVTPRPVHSACST